MAKNNPLELLKINRFSGGTSGQAKALSGKVKVSSTDSGLQFNRLSKYYETNEYYSEELKKDISDASEAVDNIIKDIEQRSSEKGIIVNIQLANEISQKIIELVERVKGVSDPFEKQNFINILDPYVTDYLNMFPLETKTKGKKTKADESVSILLGAAKEELVVLWANTKQYVEKENSKLLLGAKKVLGGLKGIAGGILNDVFQDIPFFEKIWSAGQQGISHILENRKSKREFQKEFAEQGKSDIERFKELATPEDESNLKKRSKQVKDQETTAESNETIGDESSWDNSGNHGSVYDDLKKADVLTNKTLLNTIHDFLSSFNRISSEDGFVRDDSLTQNKYQISDTDIPDGTERDPLFVKLKEGNSSNLSGIGDSLSAKKEEGRGFVSDVIAGGFGEALGKVISGKFGLGTISGIASGGVAAVTGMFTSALAGIGTVLSAVAVPVAIAAAVGAAAYGVNKAGESEEQKDLRLQRIKADELSDSLNEYEEALKTNDQNQIKAAENRYNLVKKSWDDPEYVKNRGDELFGIATTFTNIAKGDGFDELQDANIKAAQLGLESAESARDIKFKQDKKFALQNIKNFNLTSIIPENDPRLENPAFVAMVADKNSPLMTEVIKEREKLISTITNNRAIQNGWANAPNINDLTEETLRKQAVSIDYAALQLSKQTEENQLKIAEGRLNEKVTELDSLGNINIIDNSSKVVSNTTSGNSGTAPSMSDFSGAALHSRQFRGRFGGF